MHASTVVGLILAFASTTLISLSYLREHGAAGGLVFLAVASARLGHRRLTRREVTVAMLAVTGLLFLAVSLSQGDSRSAQGSLAAIALWLGATIGAGVFVFTSGRAFLERGVADGIAGGLFFAAGDIF